MNKIKLKSGLEIKLKEVTLDERDEMLDSVEYIYDNKGNITGVKMMHSTITKWLRCGLNGQATDEFILGLKLDDKSEIFTKLQSMFFVGEEKASK